MSNYKDKFEPWIEYSYEEKKDICSSNYIEVGRECYHYEGLRNKKNSILVYSAILAGLNNEMSDTFSYTNKVLADRLAMDGREVRRAIKDLEEIELVKVTHVHKPLAKLNQARLGIEQETPYINSGVMLLNLPLFREHLDLAEIRAFANKKKSILFLPDQDILTALYGDHVKLLDSLRYNLSDRVLAFHNAKSQQERLDVEWVRKNSVIVHYCGKPKPWKEHYHGSLGVFYQELAEHPNSRLKRNFIPKSDT